jgi:myo-inositol 2-dehydrogenase / D-chiro-inositol 1-dehydrogenase
MSVKRREFIARAGAAAVSMTILGPDLVRGTQAGSRVRLGLVGCGGRGGWIAGLFKKHGGYDVVAVTDYFKDRAEAIGQALSVPEGARFSGLSGYKRLLGKGVEAVAIESPPYFHPEQAAAAVDAGIHVYLAKPAAVDVPGCRSIAACARKAAAKNLSFLVDFQTRAHPAFMEAVKRIHEGALGDIVFGEAAYHADCPFEQYFELLKSGQAGAEDRLRGWGLDRALSGDMITEQDIHTIDVMNWAMKVPPLYALGTGGLTARPRIGSCWDHFVVHYQYPGKVGIAFSGRQFKGHGTAEGIRNRMFGAKGVLETEYGGGVLIRGENYWNGGRTPEIYESGVVANIATFHGSIAGSKPDQATAAPSVQSNLITILGRKSAYENRVVSWEELLKDEERLVPDLKGLKD